MGLIATTGWSLTHTLLIVKGEDDWLGSAVARFCLACLLGRAALLVGLAICIDLHLDLGMISRPTAHVQRQESCYDSTGRAREIRQRIVDENAVRIQRSANRACEISTAIGADVQRVIRAAGRGQVAGGVADWARPVMTCVVGHRDYGLVVGGYHDMLV